MFEGAITAIVTPFDENGEIDEVALRKLVDFQIKNGINGIVPVGTTGESPTLDHDEHNRVVDIVINAVNGRVPVIAGTGSNSTKEAIEMTMHAKESGATASLQVAPYYNKPTQKGFYQHFISIADAVDLPMVVYNIPGRTGKNIETSTMMKLAKHKNIVAVKEASGDLNQMMDVIAQKPADFVVLSGDDNMTVPLMAMGGKGVISVATNIIPDRVVKMVDAALKGDFKTAVKSHYELLPLFKSMFIETNPIPVKTALAMKGMLTEKFRLPMCEMEPENREKLKKILQDYKVL